MLFLDQFPCWRAVVLKSENAEAGLLVVAAQIPDLCWYVMYDALFVNNSVAVKPAGAQ